MREGVHTTAAAVAARLLDEYERGARFERADAKDVLLRLDEDAFPEAFSPGGREVMDALTADVDAIERAGAVRVVRRRVRGGGERVELRMGPGEVRAAYALAATCGYRPLRTALDTLVGHVEGLLAATARDPAPDWWRAYLGHVRDAARAADLRPLGISTRSRIKTEWPEVRDALAAADRLSRTVDAWARHVSEALFADSKRLTNIAARVATVLREADPQWSGIEAPVGPGDVLQAYGIRQRPPTITCAGAVVMHPGEDAGWGAREYHLADFQPVAVLPGAWGPALAAGTSTSGVRTVTTVENEYPFFSYVEEAGGPKGLGGRGELVVWTSGFLSGHVLDLLTRIATGGADVAFRHWGDADPAGLSIWWQLRSRLGRPVTLYRTTAEWVASAAGRDGQALTEAERRLLVAHAERFRTAGAAVVRGRVPPDDLLQAVTMAEVLLRLGVKLEQERQ